LQLLARALVHFTFYYLGQRRRASGERVILRTDRYLSGLHVCLALTLIDLGLGLFGLPLQNEEPRIGVHPAWQVQCHGREVT
jgi:hypothetical protein